MNIHMYVQSDERLDCDSTSVLFFIFIPSNWGLHDTEELQEAGFGVITMSGFVYHPIQCQQQATYARGVSHLWERSERRTQHTLCPA